MKRATISGVMLLIALALVAPVHTTFAHLSLDDSPELSSSPDAVSQVYIPHDWISIDGNEDFLSQAALEGWTGSSTENDPIIIEGNANNTDRFPLTEICVELPIGYEFEPNTPATGITAPTSVDSDPFSMYLGFMIPSLTFIAIVLLVALVFCKKRQV